MENWAFDQGAKDHGFDGFNRERFTPSTKACRWGPGQPAEVRDIPPFARKKRRMGHPIARPCALLGVTSRRPYGTPQFLWNAYPGLRPLWRTPPGAILLPP